MSSKSLVALQEFRLASSIYQKVDNFLTIYYINFHISVSRLMYDPKRSYLGSAKQFFEEVCLKIFDIIDKINENEFVKSVLNHAQL